MFRHGKDTPISPSPTVSPMAIDTNPQQRRPMNIFRSFGVNCEIWDPAETDSQSNTPTRNSHPNIELPDDEEIWSSMASIFEDESGDDDVFYVQSQATPVMQMQMLAQPVTPTQDEPPNTPEFQFYLDVHTPTEPRQVPPRPTPPVPPIPPQSEPILPPPAIAVPSTVCTRHSNGTTSSSSSHSSATRLLILCPFSRPDNS